MADNREDFMDSTQRSRIRAHEEKFFGGKRMPRTHQNMMDACGVARPGKTAKDRANRGR